MRTGSFSDRLDAILQAFHSCHGCAVRAAVERSIAFDPVSDDATATVAARWSESVNGTFERIERV